MRLPRLFAAAPRALRRLPVPLHASLLVTDRCNLSCDYCGRTHPGAAPLDADAWCDLIDQLAAAGCIRVSLTGGEPLLREDLGRIASHAQHHGIRVNLNTNGLLVPRRLDVLQHVDRVTLSLDGGPRVHDSVRGPGTHQAVMAAARAVRDAGLPLRFYTVLSRSNTVLSRSNTVLSRSNLDDLGSVIDSAETHGADAFFQPGTVLSLDGCTPNPDAPAPAAYRDAIRRLQEWKRAGRPVGNSLVALDYLLRWPDPSPIHCRSHLFCRIEADGNMRTCGRDLQVDRLDSTRLGVTEALEQRPAVTCESCWSAARVELQVLSLRTLLRR